VGELRASGAIPFTATKEADGKGVHLKVQPGSFEQGQRYIATIQWQTPEGIPLPAFEIEIGTAPP